MNKVIRMTKEIWNLPAGRALLHVDGRYCALGKLALALGHNSEDIAKASIYEEFDSIVGERDACNTVFMLNDEVDEEGNPLQSNHELAIRTGIEMLLAAGCTLETDDTVSKEFARIKSCAEEAESKLFSSVPVECVKRFVIDGMLAQGLIRTESLSNSSEEVENAR